MMSGSCAARAAANLRAKTPIFSALLTICPQLIALSIVQTAYQSVDICA
jgi:hypothetical protein